MRIILAVAVVALLTACGDVDLGSRSSSMNYARSYTDYDKGCRSKHRWMECDGVRTPSEANSGE
jgi:hypothetical protein